MGFERRQADNWRRDVPGARWFKADLHIHTIDDAPGGRAKVPACIEGPISGPEQLAAHVNAYVRDANVWTVDGDNEAFRLCWL